jgi:5-methylcytosine-specific restriction endonuclease McrA
MCGTSPLKDPAVTLHVDHIVAWSKGGRTVLNNLQTLCARCNIGKGDLTTMSESSMSRPHGDESASPEVICQGEI